MSRNSLNLIPIPLQRCWIISQWNFPRRNSHVTISLVESSQMCDLPSGNFPMVRLALHWGGRLQLAPQGRQDGLGKLPLGKLHGWENTAAWGKAFVGKVPPSLYSTCLICIRVWMRLGLTRMEYLRSSWRKQLRRFLIRV